MSKGSTASKMQAGEADHMCPSRCVRNVPNQRQKLIQYENSGVKADGSPLWLCICNGSRQGSPCVGRSTSVDTEVQTQSSSGVMPQVTRPSLSFLVSTALPLSSGYPVPTEKAWHMWGERPGSVTAMEGLEVKDAGTLTVKASSQGPPF